MAFRILQSASNFVEMMASSELASHTVRDYLLSYYCTRAIEHIRTSMYSRAVCFQRMQRIFSQIKCTVSNQYKFISNYYTSIFCRLIFFIVSSCAPRDFESCVDLLDEFLFCLILLSI